VAAVAPILLTIQVGRLMTLGADYDIRAYGCRRGTVGNSSLPFLSQSPWENKVYRKFCIWQCYCMPRIWWGTQEAGLESPGHPTNIHSPQRLMHKRLVFLVSSGKHYMTSDF